MYTAKKARERNDMLKISEEMCGTIFQHGKCFTKDGFCDKFAYKPVRPWRAKEKWICKDGNFGMDKPCQHLLDALEKVIKAGQFHTDTGKVVYKSRGKMPYHFVPDKGTRGALSYASLEEVWKEMLI